MELLHFFPKTLASIELKMNDSQNKNILNYSKILEYEAMFKDPITDKYEKNNSKGESSIYNKVLDNSKISFLKNTLQEGLDYFTQKIMLWETKTIIVNSWFNKIKPNQDTEIINQSNSILTGILFFQKEKNHPTVIFNKEKNGFDPKIKSYNELNMNNFALQTKKNYLIIMQSDINFKFSLNKSNKTHYNLMFSTMPYGTIGEKNTVLNLNINKKI